MRIFFYWKSLTVRLSFHNIGSLKETNQDAMIWTKFRLKKVQNRFKIVDGELPKISHGNSCLILK